MSSEDVCEKCGNPIDEGDIIDDDGSMLLNPKKFDVSLELSQEYYDNEEDIADARVAAIEEHTGKRIFR